MKPWACMHAHILHICTHQEWGATPASSPYIFLTHTQAYTLFLHSSPVWHTSSKPTSTSKTAHHHHHHQHEHQPSRRQRLLKTCTALSHTKTQTPTSSWKLWEKHATGVGKTLAGCGAFLYSESSSEWLKKLSCSQLLNWIYCCFFSAP